MSDSGRPLRNPGRAEPSLTIGCWHSKTPRESIPQYVTIRRAGYVDVHVWFESDFKHPRYGGYDIVTNEHVNYVRRALEFDPEFFDKELVLLREKNHVDVDSSGRHYCVTVSSWRDVLD